MSAKQKQWTWNEIVDNQKNMSDAEMDKAIGSLWPKDKRFNAIIKKVDDGEDLTPKEQKILDAWENGETRGPAGKIMGGF